jgi:hypothetical protein
MAARREAYFLPLPQPAEGLMWHNGQDVRIERPKEAASVRYGREGWNEVFEAGAGGEAVSVPSISGMFGDIYDVVSPNRKKLGKLGISAVTLAPSQCHSDGLLCRLTEKAPINKGLPL